MLLVFDSELELNDKVLSYAATIIVRCVTLLYFLNFIEQRFNRKYSLSFLFFNNLLQ